jgi:hypothetical protein
LLSRPTTDETDETPGLGSGGFPQTPDETYDETLQGVEKANVPGGIVGNVGSRNGFYESAGPERARGVSSNAKAVPSDAPAAEDEGDL